MSNDLIPSQQLQKHQRSTKAVVSIIFSSASVFLVMIALVFVTSYLRWLTRGNSNPSNLGSNEWRILTDQEVTDMKKEQAYFDNQLNWFFQSAFVGFIIGIIGALTASNANIEIERSKVPLLGARAAYWALVLGKIGAIVGFLEVALASLVTILLFFSMFVM